MRALVTGGAGFIGSHLAEALVERGDEVTVIDDLSTGRIENLESISERINLIKASILEREGLERLLDGVEVVFHQAAIPSVPRSLDDPVSTHRANVEGTFTILDAMRNSRVRRIVIASSSSVYGNSPVLPKNEGMAVAPLSPYAASKLAAEGYAQAFSRSFGLEAVVLRYFNVFGPRQNPDSQYSAAIAKFSGMVIRGERPPVYGDGLQSRDFTYVANVVRANILAAEAEYPGPGPMNIAAGTRTTILDLIGMMGRITGRDIEPEFLPERKGDVKHSLADISRARESIGYEVEVGMEEGLERTLEWFGRR